MSDPTAAAGGAAAGQHVDDYITSAEQQDQAREEKPRSLWSDAWHDLLRRPMFTVAIAVIAFLAIVAIFPQWFTGADPRLRDLARARVPPNTPYLAAILTLLGSFVIFGAAVLAVVSRFRDGVARKLTPVVTGLGGVLVLASGLVETSTLYLVLGAVMVLVAFVVGTFTGGRIIAGDSTGWALVALLLALGVTTVVLAVGDLSSVQAGAAFGYDQQGRDIYARVVYGTRWTMLVGICASVLTVLIGGTVGILAGYFGGALDSLLSRIGEVFFGLPFVLGAIVVLSAFRSAGLDSAPAIVATVVLSISILSWPIAMRIMRSAAISAKQQDYVKAARALGAKSGRIIFRHLLPNCLAPVLVYATIALGAFIGAEATLSFLGIGLRPPAVSWGVMIADSRDYIRASPLLLIFPASFLTATVLAFVMLGDAVRESLDPKLK